MSVPAATSAMQPTLAVDGLSVEFRTDTGWLRVVDDVSFSVAPGETLGIVGESGSGKTVTCMSIPRLLPHQARIAGGSIRLAGRDVSSLSERQMREIRGREIGVVFQEPSASLNPAFTIGDQIMAVLRRHQRLERRKARQQAIELLRQVGIPRADLRVDAYPHEFSGGMAQRAMIAMAIACSPTLLIADEPTTALDVTIQAQIIELFLSLQEELGMAMIVVSHDLAMVGELAHRINVMYSAEVVESGTRAEVLGAPQHPYTEGLLSAMPQFTDERGRLHVIRGSARLAGDTVIGCRFAPRCAYAKDRCRAEDVVLTQATETHARRCVRADDLSLRGWV